MEDGNILLSLARGLFSDENKKLDFSMLESGVSEFHEACFGPCDLRLWHYTPAIGVLGIIRTKSIWASSIFHMNDSSEMMHAYSMFYDRAKEYKDNTNSRQFKEFFNRFFSRPPGTPFGVYIACFSEHEDRLSQWRAYGGPGAKYALGFPAAYFRQLAANMTNETRQQEIFGEDAVQDTIFLFVKVIYKEEVKISIIDTFLKQFHQFMKNNRIDVSDDANMKKLWMLLQVALTHFGFMFKHPSFDEEGEWRLVCMHYNFSGDESRIGGASGLLFRDGPYGITPFIEVDLTRHANPNAPIVPLEQIVVGPCHDMSMSCQTAHRFLIENGMKWVSLRGSIVPLR